MYNPSVQTPRVHRFAQRLEDAGAAESEGASSPACGVRCSTTCRSEPAGDEERLLCDLRVGHSCTETLPDVPISCVGHELQMDRSREVSRCAMCGLTHAGPKRAWT